MRNDRMHLDEHRDRYSNRFLRGTPNPKRASFTCITMMSGASENTNSTSQRAQRALKDEMDTIVDESAVLSTQIPQSRSETP